MSRRVIQGFKMFDAVALSADRTSATTNCEHLDCSSIHVVWSAGSTPVGAITVQARNGEEDSWRTIDFGDPISISGASGEHEILFNQMPFTEIRLVYTRSSGTATLTAIISAKSVGQ
jgi:hypothetical protein